MKNRLFDSMQLFVWSVAICFVCVSFANTADAEDAPIDQEHPAQQEEPAEEKVEPAESEQTAQPSEEPESDSEEADSEPVELTIEAEPEIDEDNLGQEDLDNALEIKITARSVTDLNRVIDTLDEALDKGLDAGNTDFAEQVLVATLLQRASSLSGKVLNRGGVDHRDPKNMQYRLFALTDLQRAVAIDAQQSDGWLLIARLQLLPGGNPSEARRALTKVIRLAEKGATDPKIGPMEPKKLAQVHALRGATQNDPTRRLTDFTRAVELEPEKLEYRLLRAKQHQANDNAEACLEDLEVALTLEPENAGVHELKALALLMQEKNELALESFDRATELAPKAISPYQYRAELYDRLGKQEEAIEQLDKALEIQPENILVRLKRSEMLFQTEQYVKSLEDVELVLEASPGLFLGHLMKAQVLNALGRTAEADATIDNLTEKTLDDPEIQIQLAAYYAGLERPADAIPRIDNVLKIDPGNPNALSLRGNMYLVMGEHAKALRDFSKAAESLPEDSSLLNNYAWTLATSTEESLRDGNLAISIATQACELTEYGDPVMLSTLAAAYAETGDFQTAIKWSEKAVAKATENDELANFDGQLSDELESYRQNRPWREKQQVGIVQSTDEQATNEPEEEIELHGLEEAGLEMSIPADLPENRSSDF